LLQHPGNDPTCLLRTILESGCSSIAVQTTHCDTEQGSACKELLIVLAEACPQLENDEPLIEIQSLNIESMRDDPEGQHVLLTVQNIIK